MSTRTLNAILTAIIIIALIVISTYAINFQGSSISKNPEHWGQLGDYVGGILNPLLSFTTIVILITTVRIQIEQLRASREELTLTREELQKTAEAAIKQADHFEKEAKLKELLVIIEKLATRINKNFNGNNLESDYSLHTFVNLHLSNSGAYYIKAVIESYHAGNSSRTKKVVSWIVSDLKRLSDLIKRYEEVSSKDDGREYKNSPIPRFYQDEFSELTNTLLAYSMIEIDLARLYEPK